MYDHHHYDEDGWFEHYVDRVDPDGSMYNECGEFCDEDGNPYPTPEELMSDFLSWDKDEDK